MAAPILAALPIIGELVTKLVDRIPDPAARERARMEAEATLLAASIEEMKGQVAINTEEAKHASIFVAGWRPAIGWSCAIAFAFLYVVGPIAVWVASFYGVKIDLPQFNSADLMSLTFGMLGIAGFRTFEKVKGVTK